MGKLGVQYKVIVWSWPPYQGAPVDEFLRGYRVNEVLPKYDSRVILSQVSEEGVRDWANGAGVTLPFWLPTKIGEEIRVWGS